MPSPPLSRKPISFLTYAMLATHSTRWRPEPSLRRIMSAVIGLTDYARASLPPDRIVSYGFLPTPFGGFHQFQETGHFGLRRLVETPVPLFWSQLPSKILVDGQESLPALENPPARKLSPFTFTVAEGNLPTQPGTSHFQSIKSFHGVHYLSNVGFECNISTLDASTV
jgi:hypothetical protein